MGIITGGANNEWTEAMKAGLDSYLTGEISEYNWHDAKEAGIHYFAGGHHATEKFGIQSLMKKIKLELKLDCRFFDSLNPA
jgi:putative NIF3 family GTP cyclohydrolase 1 type 2